GPFDPSVADLAGGLCGLDAGAAVLLGGGGELIEDLGVVDGELAEHLAVEEDAGHLEAIDEAGVAGVAHVAGGGDAGDPEGAHVAFAVAAVAVGVAAGADEGVVGAVLMEVVDAVVAAGGAEDAFAGLGAG